MSRAIGNNKKFNFNFQIADLLYLTSAFSPFLTFQMIFIAAPSALFVIFLSSLAFDQISNRLPISFSAKSAKSAKSAMQCGDKEQIVISRYILLKIDTQSFYDVV